MSAPPDGSVLANALDPNKVSPGLLGFIIVVIIGIAVWFLARSMAKQLRKLDANTIEDPEQGDVDGAAAKDTVLKDTVAKNAASESKDTAPNGAH